MQYGYLWLNHFGWWNKIYDSEGWINATDQRTYGKNGYADALSDSNHVDSWVHTQFPRKQEDVYAVDPKQFQIHT